MNELINKGTTIGMFLYQIFWVNMKDLKPYQYVNSINKDKADTQ